MLQYMSSKLAQIQDSRWHWQHANLKTAVLNCYKIDRITSVLSLMWTCKCREHLENISQYFICWSKCSPWYCFLLFFTNIVKGCITGMYHDRQEPTIIAAEEIPSAHMNKNSFPWQQLTQGKFAHRASRIHFIWIIQA